MNDHAVILDQADEEALVCDVSDEALEAAGAMLANSSGCTMPSPWGACPRGAT